MSNASTMLLMLLLTEHALAHVIPAATLYPTTLPEPIISNPNPSFKIVAHLFGATQHQAHQPARHRIILHVH
jgi:hypothetical protein